MFLNEIFTKDDCWEFYDYKESDCYQAEKVPVENHLFCACGREVKYQYLLRAKTKNEIIGLSLKHFSDHTNIPEKIARNVREGIQKINRHLDDILIRVSRGEGFQSFIANAVGFYNGQVAFPDMLKERMNAFYKVDLPMSTKDTNKVNQIIADFKHIQREKECEEERQRHEEWLKSRKRPKSIGDDEFLGDIIKLIDQYYVEKDVIIDINQITILLKKKSGYVHERLIGYVGPAMKLISNEVCPGHLIQESHFTYRKLKSEPMA
ncbi:hypothetical protein IW492_03110 [Enterococcus sp. BWB1-3]|uniref:hypothetical protein n=1 Tax=Enterococcus sp. BWB1-3 TaxID=2787713 RepID=UPI0019218929|nr:hypothetical protein [Enterococcus sp. BWB1-3]MBL1228222.1 hypothetical protein [Enterococcus sp. BWB1-3]